MRYALATVGAFLAGFVLCLLVVPRGAADRSGADHDRPPGTHKAGPFDGTNKSGTLPFARNGSAEAEAILADIDAILDEPEIDARRYARLMITAERVDHENGPAIASALASQLPDDDRLAALQLVIESWAASDLEGALAFASSLPRENDRLATTRNVLLSWARTDYDAARNYVSQRTGQDRDAGWVAILDALAQKDPQRAITEALGQEDSISGPFYEAIKFGVIPNAIRTWAARNPRAALDAVSELPPGEMRNSALQIAASMWFEKDHTAALDWLGKIPSGTMKRDLTRNFLSTWYRDDSRSAVAWIHSLPDNGERNDLVESIAFSAAGTDPEAFIDLLELVSSPSRQEDLIRSFAMQWAYQDSEAVITWAAAQTDSEIQQSIWNGIISSIAIQKPKRAAELLTHLSPEEQASAISSIANAWAQQDPEKAFRWATMQAGNERENAIGAVISTWIRYDAPSALAQLEKLPADTHRDAIIRHCLYSIQDESPLLALQWASSISDQEIRLSAQESTVRQWMHKDPNAARTWVQQSALPADKKQELLTENSWQVNAFSRSHLLPRLLPIGLFGAGLWIGWQWAAGHVERSLLRAEEPPPQLSELPPPPTSESSFTSPPSRSADVSREQPAQPLHSGTFDFHAAAARLVTSHPLPEQELILLVQAWSEAAFAWIEATPFNPKARTSVLAFFEAWATRDPDAALQAASSYAPPGAASSPEVARAFEALRRDLMEQVKK